MYTYYRDPIKKKEPNFSVVSRDKTRGKRHKMRYVKIILNRRKRDFIVRVIKQWNIFPQEAVVCLSLETLKPSWMCLDNVKR